MTKESSSSVRKCSHCGHNGHNLRTCNGKGCFKLFGVKIDLNNNNNNASKEDESISSIRKSSNGGGEKREEEESIRKCKSTGNLLQASNSDHRVGDAAAAGYLSDGFIQSERAKNAHERKKGIFFAFYPLLSVNELFSTLFFCVFIMMINNFRGHVYLT